MIICAACKLEDIILCGARHWDSVMRSQYKYMPGLRNYFEQGFIDERGNFYTREEALTHAKQCSQSIDYDRNGSVTKLFSEGLY